MDVVTKKGHIIRTDFSQNSGKKLCTKIERGNHEHLVGIVRDDVTHVFDEQTGKLTKTVYQKSHGARNMESGIAKLVRYAEDGKTIIEEKSATIKPGNGGSHTAYLWTLPTV